jgi:hypothetical protein
VLKGSVGGGWADVFMKNRPIEMETNEKSPALCRTGHLGVNTTRRMWPDWLGQD